MYSDSEDELSAKHTPTPKPTPVQQVQLGNTEQSTTLVSTKTTGTMTPRTGSRASSLVAQVQGPLHNAVIDSFESGQGNEATRGPSQLPTAPSSEPDKSVKTTDLKRKSSAEQGVTVPSTLGSKPSHTVIPKLNRHAYEIHKRGPGPERDQPKKMTANYDDVDGPFAQWRLYNTFTNITKDVETWPPIRVVLQDWHVWQLMIHSTGKSRKENWPADFDSSGLPRMPRKNKGRAAKELSSGTWRYKVVADHYVLCGDEGAGNISKTINSAYVKPIKTTDGPACVLQYDFTPSEQELRSGLDTNRFINPAVEPERIPEAKKQKLGRAPTATMGPAQPPRRPPVHPAAEKPQPAPAKAQQSQQTPEKSQPGSESPGGILQLPTALASHLMPSIEQDSPKSLMSSLFTRAESDGSSSSLAVPPRPARQTATKETGVYLLTTAAALHEASAANNLAIAQLPSIQARLSTLLASDSAQQLSPEFVTQTHQTLTEISALITTLRQREQGAIDAVYASIDKAGLPRLPMQNALATLREAAKGKGARAQSEMTGLVGQRDWLNGVVDGATAKLWASDQVKAMDRLKLVQGNVVVVEGDVEMQN